MKLGAETCQIRKKFGDRQAIRLIREAGFDCVDYSFHGTDEQWTMLDDHYRDYARELRDYMSGLGIGCTQTHAPFAFRFGEEMALSQPHYRDIVRAIEFSALLGAQYTVVHSILTPAGVDLTDYNLLFFKSLEPYCVRYGVRIGFENIFDYDPYHRCMGRFETPERVREFLARLDSPWFVACLDTGHAAISGVKPEDFVHGMDRQTLRLLHVQDTDFLDDRHQLPYLGSHDWDAFAAACQTIIDTGMVPMVNHNSAGDLTHVAGVFTTYDDALSCDREAQLDGTWDWESFMAELEYFSNLIDMGAYWEDRTTMDSTADIERIASGKSVFYFGNSTNYCTSCEELNPDNEYAVIPFPAAKEGGNRYICGGEGYACGIWKDTKNLEASRAWLAYLAENGGLIAQNFGGVPAMDTLEIEEIAPIKVAKETMEHYPDAIYVNLWDREYMPSGMWATFGEAVGMLYADNSPENLVAIKDFLKENYDEKYAAAHGA